MNHIADSENLVDCKPVKARIGINSPRAFWEHVRKQGIPHYQLNERVIRFRMSEVEEWLAARKKGGDL